MASRQRIKPEPYLLPVAADSRKYLVRLVQNQFDVREEEILAELSECASCLLYVLVCATNAMPHIHAPTLQESQQGEWCFMATIVQGRDQEG
jgi:hypothetical protein